MADQGDLLARAQPPGMAEEPDHKGHRERLRVRFLTGGADPLPDYELLELILMGALPRVDVKPIAKALLRRFDSFEETISADPEDLKTVPGLGLAGVAALKVAQAAALRLLQRQVINKHVLSSWDKLMDYCLASNAYEATERFRLLFLDIKNRLIADEVQQRGTVNHTPVYPREVVKRALELNASALIMVHNHPSGDLTPSKADIEMTRTIRDALAPVGITLHDHVIVGRTGHASFKSQGLL